MNDLQSLKVCSPMPFYRGIYTAMKQHLFSSFFETRSIRENHAMRGIIAQILLRDSSLYCAIGLKVARFSVLIAR